MILYMNIHLSYIIGCILNLSSNILWASLPTSLMTNQVNAFQYSWNWPENNTDCETQATTMDVAGDPFTLIVIGGTTKSINLFNMTGCEDTAKSFIAVINSTQGLSDI